MAGQPSGVDGTTAELADASYGVGMVTTADTSELNGPNFNMGGTGLALTKPSDVSTWTFRQENASAAAAVTGPTAVVGAWIEVFAVNNGSGTWAVTFNGASAGSITGVPTSGMVFPCIWIDDDSAAAADRKAMLVDEFEIGVLISGNRFD